MYGVVSFPDSNLLSRLHRFLALCITMYLPYVSRKRIIYPNLLRKSRAFPKEASDITTLLIDSKCCGWEVRLTSDVSCNFDIEFLRAFISSVVVVSFPGGTSWIAVKISGSVHMQIYFARALSFVNVDLLGV